MKEYIKKVHPVSKSEKTIHCSCAIGDLYEMAEKNALSKTQPKAPVKDLKRNITNKKKQSGNSK